MKKLTMEEWEKDYIVENIQRMEQKNIVFKRTRWDMETLVGGKTLAEWRDRVFGVLDPRDKAGFTLQDMAFANAAWCLEVGFARGNALGDYGLFKWNPDPIGLCRITEGNKLDINDTVEFTRDIKNVATFFGADAVGVCDVDHRWIYSHYYDGIADQSKPLEIGDEYKQAIVMVHEMDYNIDKYSPTWVATGSIGIGYTKMAFTAGLLTQFIRNLGYKAIPSGNDTALNVPMAMQAGLGQIGRSGLLITPWYGPRVRISKIFTDMPLVSDRPIDFGVTEFCTTCGLCAEACPGQAIMKDKMRTVEPHNISNVRGALKWPIDGEKCYKFWGQNGAPCSNCIRSCPFNKHMNWFHRSTLWFVDHFRFGDRLYKSLDQLAGYGKHLKAEDFWDKYEPRQGLRLTQK